MGEVRTVSRRITTRPGRRFDSVPCPVRAPRAFDSSRIAEKWSGRLDSNQRPLRPERSALPGCATPRLAAEYDAFSVYAQGEAVSTPGRPIRAAVRGRWGPGPGLE